MAAHISTYSNICSRNVKKNFSSLKRARYHDTAWLLNWQVCMAYHSLSGHLRHALPAGQQCTHALRSGSTFISHPSNILPLTQRDRRCAVRTDTWNVRPWGLEEKHIVYTCHASHKSKSFRQERTVQKKWMSVFLWPANVLEKLPLSTTQPCNEVWRRFMQFLLLKDLRQSAQHSGVLFLCSLRQKSLDKWPGHHLACIVCSRIVSCLFKHSEIGKICYIAD